MLGRSEEEAAVVVSDVDSSAPKDAPVVCSEADSCHTTDSSRGYRGSSRGSHEDRLRTRPHPHRSSKRFIPNLLSGAPLIPGPMTPQYAPLSYASSGDNSQHMPIFPRFMIAPNSIPDVDSEFVRCAMENAVGLPPLFALPEGVFHGALSDSGCSEQKHSPHKGRSSFGSHHGQPRHNKKNFSRRSPARGPARMRDMPILESNFEFPILEGLASSVSMLSSTTAATTPSVCPSPSPIMKQSKMSHAKFPSKNQLKKKCP